MRSKNSQIISLAGQILSDQPPIHTPSDTVTPIFEVYKDYCRQVLAQHSDEVLLKIQEYLFQNNNRDAFAAHLVLKLELGRRFIASSLPSQGVTVYVLNPMYKETKRLAPRTSSNPYGENALLEKIKYYRELERESNGRLGIHYLAIDDVCPDGSGEIAKWLLKKAYPKDFGHKYQVIDLRNGINEKKYPPKGARNGSIKGGSIHYGMAYVLAQARGKATDCFILDTDTDLSIHPGQLSLALRESYKKRALAIIASRRQHDSVAKIEPQRDNRGKLYIAIIQSLLPGIAAAGILDTNRALKLYRLSAAEIVHIEQRIFQFPYQIENILSAQKYFPHETVPLGIVSVDSPALSTSTFLASYYDQILTICNLADQFMGNRHAAQLKNYLRKLGARGWQEFEQQLAMVLDSVEVNQLQNINLAILLQEYLKMHFIIDSVQSRTPR